MPATDTGTAQNKDKDPKQSLWQLTGHLSLTLDSSRMNISDENLFIVSRLSWYFDI